MRTLDVVSKTELTPEASVVGWLRVRPNAASAARYAMLRTVAPTVSDGEPETLRHRLTLDSPSLASP